MGEFGCRVVDDGAGDAMRLLEHAIEQDARAEAVDTARNAAGVGEHAGESVIVPMRVVRPADCVQAVLDIGPCLFLAQRPEMVGCQHTLAKLIEARAREHPAELRLAQQNGLHGGVAVDRDVRQHAQFLERGQ